MTATDPPSYDELPARLQLLADNLRRCDNPALANDIATFLDWNEAFNRRGLNRLVEMIEAWRGDIFLDAVRRDPIAASFLKAYRLPT